MEKIHASKLLAGLVPAGKLTSDPEVALVTTDSREVKPGCIFVAFPGERFDGHDFAARALEQGAEYVVVNHPVPGVPEEKAILCPDSYHAMMVMGANYRSQYHPKMVGVTGSVGKTTTKQMTYAALCGFGETIKSYVAEGRDLNTLVSIPLAIAGWLRYLLAVDDNGNAFEVSADPLKDDLQAKLATIKFGAPDSCTDQLDSILSNASIFGSDLTKTVLADKVKVYFKAEIAGPGAVRKTLHDAVNA